MPDAGAGESVDNADPQFLSGPRGILHLFDRPCCDSGRIAVTPDVWRKNRLVASVDVVEHRLADKMIGNGEQLQVVFFQQLTFTGTIRIIRNRFVHFEVIAPAGQLQAVVTKVASLFAQRLKRQIGPLACEQSNRTSHRIAPRWLF